MERDSSRRRPLRLAGERLRLKRVASLGRERTRLASAVASLACGLASWPRAHAGGTRAIGAARRRRRPLRAAFEADRSALARRIFSSARGAREIVLVLHIVAHWSNHGIGSSRYCRTSFAVGHRAETMRMAQRPGLISRRGAAACLPCRTRSRPARGAVLVLPPARFPGPLAEPAVPISR